MKLNLSLQQNFQSPELVVKRAHIKKVVETALRHIDTQSDCEIGIACVDNDESHTKCRRAPEYPDPVPKQLQYKHDWPQSFYELPTPRSPAFVHAMNSPDY